MPETVSHPLFARFYERLAPAMEKQGGAEHREELLAGLTGRVVEVGAGVGSNFKHYPAGVTEVIAVEPESRLRASAERAAAEAAVTVRVVDGVAGELPVQDGSCDAAVASMVLCSVPDPAAALAEFHRVLKPGGELRFYEHVLAHHAGFARYQGLVDPVWKRLFGGCRVNRDTEAAISAAGFTVDSARRFRFPPGNAPMPAAPHVIGIAHRS